MLPLALALAAAASVPPCDLGHLARCPDTNALVWSKGWDKAVRDFLGPLGSKRVDYLDRGGTLSSAVAAVLGGPPDERARAGEYYRFSACRAHSCPEKGAVLLTPNGRIQAIAVLHSDCAKMPTPDHCFLHDHLVVIVRDLKITRKAVGYLTDWAKKAEAADHAAYHQPASRLDGVEVLHVGGRGGIRTHGELAPTAVFKTAALNHSATRPFPGASA